MSINRVVLKCGSRALAVGAALALVAAPLLQSTPAEARKSAPLRQVKYVSKSQLRSACRAAGGVWDEIAFSYSCTLPDGRIYVCNSSLRRCDTTKANSSMGGAAAVGRPTASPKSKTVRDHRTKAPARRLVPDVQKVANSSEPAGSEKGTRSQQRVTPILEGPKAGMLERPKAKILERPTFGAAALAGKQPGSAGFREGGACKVVSGTNTGKSGTFDEGYCCDEKKWGCTDCTDTRGGDNGRCKATTRASILLSPRLAGSASKHRAFRAQR